MGTLWQDLRFGLRLFRRSPGFVIVALLTLALGIGANTTIFSVVNAVVLRPLPFPNPEQLVIVWQTDSNRKIAKGTCPPADFLDWRAQNRVFQQMAALEGWLPTLTGSGEAEQLLGARVSANFLQMLGVKPALGRAFRPQEEQLGHAQVVLLSHGLWVRHFGADPGVIGRSIVLDDEPYTVIGVLPAAFNLLERSTKYDVWVPLAFRPSEIRRDNPSLIVFARLKNGVTVPQAEADMQTVTHRLAAEYPAVDSGSGANVMSLHDDLVGSLGEPLLVLLAAVGLVLLIACANVANLLLSRSTGRQGEVAIRAALGASRPRIFRQLLTESVLLGLLGGACGLAVAYAGLRVLPAILPAPGTLGELPHAKFMGINFPVLAYTVGAAILAGIIFGAAPALQFSKGELNESLKEGGRGSLGGRRSRLTRDVLVIAEVGLSLVLLIGAGTLLRSFYGLLAQNPGFNPRNVLSFQLWLPGDRYRSPAEQRAFYQRALERMRAIPGVQSAGAINFLPLTGWTDFADFDIEGRRPPPHQVFTAQYRVIDPHYFQTMQIPLIRGRYFSEGDGEEAPAAVIINHALAEKYWGNANPVGQRMRIHLQASQAIPYRPSVSDAWATIVGVTGDVQDLGPLARDPGQFFLPEGQVPSPLMRIVLRTVGSPVALVPAVRQAVGSLDKNLPVTSLGTLEQFLSNSTSSDRVSTTLLAFFAGLALVLAAIGIYGVISCSVEQRTHEIGIRMALGAQRRDVLRLMVGHGMGLAVVGVVLGIAAAASVTHLLAGYLFGIQSLNPATSLAAVLILLLVALLACFLPARRATRVDPLRALRYQ